MTEQEILDTRGAGGRLIEQEVVDTLPASGRLTEQELLDTLRAGGRLTEEEILNTLRADGHRLTAPRRKLVDLLLRAEAPLTAEEIYQRGRRARLGANLSTVYRNLATFCEMGWLDAVPGTNGERYYQVHASAEQRLSVLCLDCGQLTTLKVDAAAPLNAAVRNLGFNANSLRVSLAAHCEHVCGRKLEVGGQRSEVGSER